MIITFTGHSLIDQGASLKKKIEQTIFENIQSCDEILFYCGGYGEFDHLCESVCRDVKAKIANCKLAFITPYITEAQQKKMNSLINEKRFDMIIYPPLEKVPSRIAISRRNEWMIDHADLVIAYVTHSYGGAYHTLEYAHRKGKRVINLSIKTLH